MARTARIVVLIGFLVAVVAVAAAPNRDGIRWPTGHRSTPVTVVGSALRG